MLLNSVIKDLALFKLDICIEVGPEILSGSTRLKSGSAQKMVLNMISTGAMVRIGKCYGNRMVDLNASNNKLKARALNLLTDITAVSKADALSALIKSDWQVKVAALMLSKNCTQAQAVALLAENNGHLRRALECE